MYEVKKVTFAHQITSHTTMKHISALHSRYITSCFARDKCLKYQIGRTESGRLGPYSFDHRLDSEQIQYDTFSQITIFIHSERKKYAAK